MNAIARLYGWGLPSSFSWLSLVSRAISLLFRGQYPQSEWASGLFLRGKGWRIQRSSRQGWPSLWDSFPHRFRGLWVGRLSVWICSRGLRWGSSFSIPSSSPYLARGIWGRQASPKAVPSGVLLSRPLRIQTWSLTWKVEPCCALFCETVVQLRALQHLCLSFPVLGRALCFSPCSRMGLLCFGPS